MHFQTKIDHSCLGGPKIDLPCKIKFKAKMYLYFFTQNKHCSKQKKKFLNCLFT